jgi:hypothetical protein
MSPVTRANWWLSGLALLLATAAWWCQQGSRPVTETITALPITQIKEIRILRDGQPLSRLTRRNQDWIWSSSGKAVQDEEWVNKLLHIARLPSLHHFPVDPARLADFALEPPRYTLILNDLPLEFGKLDPASGLRYLRVGQTIHLITDSYTHLLSRDKP